MPAQFAMLLGIACGTWIVALIVMFVIVALVWLWLEGEHEDRVSDEAARNILEQMKGKK